MPPKKSAAATKKRKAPSGTAYGKDDKRPHETEVEEPPKKQAKQTNPIEYSARTQTSSPKLQKLIDTYGTFPLEDYGLEEPKSPTAPTMLAHLFNAMLTSARISHELAAKSVKCLIEAGYHDIATLKESSWEERTEVLTKGGYTRYREKTATGLGELAELIANKYGRSCYLLVLLSMEQRRTTPLLASGRLLTRANPDNDLNNLVKVAKEDAKKIRELVKEIKGFGDVGVNIFCDTAQALWPPLVPTLDPRSLKTCEEIGLGSDVQKLYEELGKAPEKMARLCVALTTVRLGKKQREFK